LYDMLQIYHSIFQWYKWD